MMQTYEIEVILKGTRSQRLASNKSFDELHNEWNEALAFLEEFRPTYRTFEQYAYDHYVQKYPSLVSVDFFGWRLEGSVYVLTFTDENDSILFKFRES